MKVILVPSWEEAEQFAKDNDIIASVEAEYGDNIIEGRKNTLAHHGSRSNNPAPCNTNVIPLDENEGVILLSHLDLDAIGGVLALLDMKPKDDEFWKGAEHIDVNGLHHMHDLSQDTQDKLNGWYYYTNENTPRTRYTEATDVTSIIYQSQEALQDILTGTALGKEYIEKGRQWTSEMNEKTENQLVSENDDVRFFISDGSSSCMGAYFSPNQNKIMKAEVIINMKNKAVTVGFAEPGDYSAKEIVQSLWGKEAGGRDVIAGSPRNWDISDDDLIKEGEKALELVKEALK